MQMPRVRLNSIMAGGFLVFAVGYLVSFIMMPTTDMIGDTRGYDPGGRVVPMAASGCMALLSLWLFVRSLRPQSARPPESIPVGLLAANILISAAYIAFFRPAGYVVATCLTLYWLTILNLRSIEVKIGWGTALAWMGATLAYLLALYSLMRGVIRGMFWAARSYAVPAAREPALQALVAGVVLAVLFILAGKVLRRMAPVSEMATAVQSSIGTTLSIYIVFRLLFLVQLPSGLLTW